MRQHERRQADVPAGRAAQGGTGCSSQRPRQPGTGTGSGRQRPGPGGLWLLLIPAACCAGPLLIAGLAAAGTLAWGGLGLAVAAVLAGAQPAIRLYRRARARSGAREERGKPQAAGPQVRPR